MNEQEYVPTLTFAAAPVTPADQQAAAQTAAAQAAAEPEAPVVTATQHEESQLSEAELKAVEEFSKKIDITDSNAVLQYGAASQKNIADFSGTTLANVRTKDMGQVGDMLSDLVVELKGFNYGEEEKKGLFGFKRKMEKQIASIKSQYDKAEVNVDKIAGMLEQHQITLLKDVATLDKMYDLNLAYYKELTMYILAGKKKLAECEQVELPKFQEKARTTGLPEDAQAVNDYQNMITRFDKKLHDLELTRMISVQMSPQIRLIQNNDALMAEKIQTAIVNTIPLWKSQMVLAMSMYHSQQAMEATHSVSEVTNELLKKNAAALHTGSVGVAQEAERGIVDLETLQQTNQELIATLEDVRKIQVDGRARRAQAEIELGRIEGQLKQKLLELRG